ncbi:MAG: hypothetical protein IPJ28_15100 [Betaproteobacteria bacterium]|nr:hypothetical protein [Betaproteobacteria bacterium]
MSVWTKFSGIVTYGEVLDTTNTLYGNPRCDDVVHAYWDFSEIDGFVVDENEVEEMAYVDHAASLYLRPMKAAFILKRPGPAGTGPQYIAHMQSLGSTWQNRIFPTMERSAGLDGLGPLNPDDKPSPTLAALVREQLAIPWSRARRLCEEGRVSVDGVPCLEPAARVKTGAVVVVNEHGPKRRKGRYPRRRSCTPTGPWS